MRVTNAIRDYVTDVICAKYDEKSREIGKEYRAELGALEEEVKAIADEANMRALELIASRGFEVNNPGYRRDDGLITMSGQFYKRGEYNRISVETTRLNQRKNDKIRQVLFELEMGKTAKDALVAFLENVEVD